MASPVLIAHAADSGGYIGHNVDRLECGPIDTTGANFIFVAFSAGGNAANVMAFGDSEGNTWTRLPPPFGQDWGTFESSIAFYSCFNPTTSAAHVFTAPCNPGQGHGAIGVQAWSHISSPTPTAYAWNRYGTSVTVGPLDLTTGIAITVSMLSFDEMATGDQTPTVNAPWDTSDSVPALQVVFGHTGLCLASQVLAAPASISATWTYADISQIGGAALFGYHGESPSPPPTSTTSLIVRQRVITLPGAENYLMFLRRLEVLIQAGMGTSTGQGSDPVLMVELSKDGGFTWGPQRQLSVGKIGEYAKRCYGHNWGQSRQWVARITQTDPTFTAWLDLLIDVEKGLS